MSTRTATRRRPRQAAVVVDPCTALPITATDLMGDLDPGWPAWREEGHADAATDSEAA